MAHAASPGQFMVAAGRREVEAAIQEAARRTGSDRTARAQTQQRADGLVQIVRGARLRTPMLEMGL